MRKQKIASQKDKVVTGVNLINNNSHKECLLAFNDFIYLFIYGI
jgi:hypothetical protein